MNEDEIGPILERLANLEQEVKLLTKVVALKISNDQIKDLDDK